MDAENLRNPVRFVVRFVVMRGATYSTVFQPSAAHFSWDPLGKHKLDPDKPKNSWDT